MKGNKMEEVPRPEDLKRDSESKHVYVRRAENGFVIEPKYPSPTYIAEDVDELGLILSAYFKD